MTITIRSDTTRKSTAGRLSAACRLAQFRPQPRDRPRAGRDRDRSFVSGLLVAAISKLSELAHSLLFDIPFDAHLSATGVISWQRTLLIPILGGVVLASIGMFFAGRLKGQQLADAIEANALYGGRVSFRGSLLISIQTLLSNGFGGLGRARGRLHADLRGVQFAYRPAAGGAPQRHAAAGGLRRGRRHQRRLLRAAGRARSSRSKSCSAPIRRRGWCRSSPARSASWLVARHLTHLSFLMVPGFPSPVSVEMIGQTVLIGVICAFASIVVMLAVAFSERCFQRLTDLQRLPEAGPRRRPARRRSRCSRPPCSAPAMARCRSCW